MQLHVTKMYHDEVDFLHFAIGCNVYETIFIKSLLNFIFVWEQTLIISLSKDLFMRLLTAPINTFFEFNVFAFCGSPKFGFQKVGQPFMLLRN